MPANQLSQLVAKDEMEGCPVAPPNKTSERSQFRDEQLISLFFAFIPRREAKCRMMKSRIKY